MRNRDIVIKLRTYTKDLTWQELNNITKQQVIDNISFNSYELEQLDKWGKIAFNWLKGEWIRDQHLGFVTGKIRDVMTAARLNAIDYMVLQGLSEDTAKNVFKNGFKAFSEEVTNG